MDIIKWTVISFHTDCFDGFAQDCSNPIASALELLQYCVKPPIYPLKLQIAAKQRSVPGRICTREVIAISRTRKAGV